MLQFELLKNHAGIVLIGDYLTLLELHALVHRVNEECPYIRDKEGAFLGLAYDLRKAYELQRRVIAPPSHTPQMGPRYGVEILWPVLLFQARLLRQGLSWVPHRSGDQSLIYGLEEVIESALEADFKDRADAIKGAWRNMVLSRDDDDLKLRTRGALFCFWRKARRRQSLADLLESFSPMYEITYQCWAKLPRHGKLDPAEIEAWEGADWPDPKW
ncbi:hypothetical protein [Caulobacter sp. CCH5-E12]|uniref:DUF6904 family protein n=1 Tax=Caulobacter sp. CCH5-E12 TaxID=1768770 RepID=UPI0007858EC1|nr:hypothetical protein [Caulobacter sp. CCH5-E12]